MFERFTEKAIKVVMLAQEEARRLGHNFVGTEQVLLGLVGEGTGVGPTVLQSMGVTLADVRLEVEAIIGRGSGFVAVEIPFTPRAKRILELSLDEARKLGHSYVGTEHLLLSLVREGDGVATRVLENLGINLEDIRGQVISALGEYPLESPSNPVNGEYSPTVTLEEFGVDLTQRAIDGELDPVVGRQPEIERVIQILGRRTKNNPVLIGEPGVGKTAVAEGLAQRITTNDIPDYLEEKLVVSLDIGMIVAGTKYRGEFEERLKKVMDEVRIAENIILVLDEVHTIIGAGAAEGAIDAANILKPALARGELQCIGATTIEEYRKYIEKDPALERRFQPVTVGEPTVNETIEILYGLRERYERHHKLIISDDAINAAARLADQYIADRFLPDKAIDLIDEAGSRVRLLNSILPPEAKDLGDELRALGKTKEDAVREQRYEDAGEIHLLEMEVKIQIDSIIEAKNGPGSLKPMVTEETIAEIVSAWTSIPVNKLTRSESDKLLKMEETLHQRIIGQNEAVSAVARAIRRARVGLKPTNRPTATFLFSGPTGVGKTELAKALAGYFFGSEESMIRLDMSEYMERHTASKLIGSPPGYVGYNEGGQLTEAVRRRPHAVVLFDEVEKAHPDVFNLLLQIFEDGRLTDSKGRTIDFKNTVIIMTSNLGSNLIDKKLKRIGFESRKDKRNEQFVKISNLLNEELKQFFKPEFLNRIDEIVIFQQLDLGEVAQIADLFFSDICDRLMDQGRQLELTSRYKSHVVNEGYSATYGARPLRRAIMYLLEDIVAEKILLGEYERGDTAVFDVVKDEFEEKTVKIFIQKLNKSLVTK